MNPETEKGHPAGKLVAPKTSQGDRHMSARVSVKSNRNNCSVVRLDGDKIKESLFLDIFEFDRDLEPHEARALGARLETLAGEVVRAALAVELARITAHGGTLYCERCFKPLRNDTPPLQTFCRACDFERYRTEPTEVGAVVQAEIADCRPRFVGPSIDVRGTRNACNITYGSPNGPPALPAVEK